jgi:hypothetical protein
MDRFVIALILAVAAAQTASAEETQLYWGDTHLIQSISSTQSSVSVGNPSMNATRRRDFG